MKMFFSRKLIEIIEICYTYAIMERLIQCLGSSGLINSLSGSGAFSCDEPNYHILTKG